MLLSRGRRSARIGVTFCLVLLFFWLVSVLSCSELCALRACTSVFARVGTCFHVVVVALLSHICIYIPAFNRTIAQAEAKALKDHIESASAPPSDPPQANGSAPDESVAAAAAAAAAQAAAEEEAKSLKEELRSVRDALEASEESRKSVENLLAETKQVRGRVPRQTETHCCRCC